MFTIFDGIAHLLKLIFAGVWDSTIPKHWFLYVLVILAFAYDPKKFLFLFLDQSLGLITLFPKVDLRIRRCMEFF